MMEASRCGWCMSVSLVQFCPQETVRRSARQKIMRQIGQLPTAFAVVTLFPDRSTFCHHSTLVLENVPRVPLAKKQADTGVRSLQEAQFAAIQAPHTCGRPKGPVPPERGKRPRCKRCDRHIAQERLELFFFFSARDSAEEETHAL